MSGSLEELLILHNHFSNADRRSIYIETMEWNYVINIKDMTGLQAVWSRIPRFRWCVHSDVCTAGRIYEKWLLRYAFLKDQKLLSCIVKHSSCMRKKFCQSGVLSLDEMKLSRTTFFSRPH